MFSRRAIRLAGLLAIFALPCSQATFGEDSRPSVAAEPSVKVALYAGGGTGKTVKHVEQALQMDARIGVTKLMPEDVRAGRLDEFDVVVLPGGSGSRQAKALGSEGRSKIREFVRNGGGYVGVCAGSYLASCDYEWSLGILDAKVVDRQHWARGFGHVAVGFTHAGRTRLGVEKDALSIYYHQGPLLAPADNPEIDDYEPLATFAGEIAKNGAPSGVMPGTTAIAAGRFGKGDVLCFSPHPEKTEGQSRLLVKAVLIASDKNDKSP